MRDSWVSRFFQQSDPYSNVILVPLPKTWWSRPYEYHWAQEFADPTAVVLDAASGVSHPFKFWLGTRCRITHACDIDPRIGDDRTLLEGIIDDFGPENARYLMDNYVSKIHLVQASILELPYNDQSLDTVFCLSVLEHLSSTEQVKTLSEFFRILKPGGLLVITLDYPTVNRAFFHHIVLKAGFAFAGPVDFSIPHNLLTSPNGELGCFRAVLRRSLIQWEGI